ncbi:hypothetical protein ACJRO7_035031 [Eucalyptus globulus]|uniref:F-box domain-containing protein n=1 Tax=Eucalyptus globulus TaxID=34317 RepID=A0ABD3JFA6_EUCGL
MAEWSQMPEDLLRLIARRLDTQFDVLRLRSVCSSWRSSVAPSPNPFRRGRIPIISHGGDPDDCTGVYLLPKRTIFLVGVPRSCDRTDFPRVLDLMNMRVLELGHEYVLQDTHYHGYSDDYDIIDTNKVAFLCLDNENDFALLRTVDYGMLAMLKSREKRWSNVQDMPSPYHGMILFKGEFYAVDRAGRTVVVGLDLSVTLIAQLNFHGSEKFLVESVGELLLVNRYLSHDTENVHDGMVAELADNFDCFMRERTLRCKVYKLDREEEVWNEVKDLGDRVLFLGEGCTFSASAADLGACKENCIFFVDPDGGIAAMSLPIVVYDMESGIFVPIEDYADYSQLFWPPPDWIASKTSEVQNQLESLVV